MRRGFLKTNVNRTTTTSTATHPSKDHDSSQSLDPMKILPIDKNTDDYEHRLIMTRQPCLPNGTTECLITGWVWRQITNTPGFPKSIEIPENGPAHRISEVPGMGKAMFATRKLSAGDLVLDERPLLVCPTYIPGASLREQEKILKLLFDRMRPEDQQAYMELPNRHHRGGNGPIRGILSTNGFTVGEELRNKGSRENDIAAQYVTLCKDLSRVNHSCSPNVTRTWNTSSLSMQIRAVRDIVPDEEITLTYIDTVATYEERKAQLRKHNIECKCPACLNHAVSDIRRKGFREHPAINAPIVRDPDEALDAWIQPALNLLAEMEEEGVEADTAYGNTLLQIVKGYAVIGDERAVMYGKKLYAFQRASRKEDAEDGLFLELTELSTLKHAMSFLWGASLKVADAGEPLALVHA